jgi:hypothetical protein
MLSVPLQLPDADIVFYPSLLDEQESDRLLTQLTESDRLATGLDYDLRAFNASTQTNGLVW